MDATESCPHPLSRPDAAAVIGVLATVEVHVRNGTLDADGVADLRRRLTRDGRLPEPGRDDVAGALSGLTQALRTALGEHD
jgi:hypothetical protein